MKKYLIKYLKLNLLILIAVITSCGKSARSVQGDVFIYNTENLKKAREAYHNKQEPYYSAVLLLLDKADALLADPFTTVVNKKHIPPGGSKNDYYSIGVYWWPDSTQSDGLPYVKRDGFRNPELNDYDAPKLQNMIRMVLYQSAAYFYTGRQEYAEKAIGQLKVWFIDQNTKMNPHLEYGQAIPGIVSGRANGIIETVNLIWVADAVGLLSMDGLVDEYLMGGLKSWFKDYNHWLLTSEKGIEESGWHNNHGTVYDCQVATFARFTGNDSLAKAVIESAKIKRIAAHIEADGRQPGELDRTRSLHYSIYNLKFHYILALLAEDFGIDFWDFKIQGNRPLYKAITFLLPYVFQEKEWPYQQVTGFEKPKREFFHVLNIAMQKYNDPVLKKYYDQYNPKDENVLMELVLFPY